MTKAQQNKIDMIRKQAENLHGSDKDFEIKRFDAKDNGIFIELCVEVGLKGNDTYCSDRLQVFINENGGVKMPFNGTIKTFHRMEFGENNKG